VRARLGRVPKGARSFADIETALRQIRAGKMVVVVDDEDRENEGDFRHGGRAGDGPRT